MKNITRLGVLVLFLGLLPGLQGCRAYVYGPGWHHHGGWHRPPGAQADLNLKSSAVQLAQDYDISQQSAEKIVTFAGTTDLTDKKKALAELGVTTREVAPLAKMQLLSDETFDKIADALGEDSYKVHNVFEGFTEDVKAER